MRTFGLKETQYSVQTKLVASRGCLTATRASCRRRGQTPAFPSTLSGTTSGGPSWERTKKVLLAGHASKIVHLENLIPTVDIEHVPQEQLAMTDMLMLASSEKYVGINYSSFSIFAALLRKRLGYAFDDSALINLSKDSHEGLMRITRNGSFVTAIREMTLD